MDTNLVNREKAITKTSVIGILANVLLAGFKATVGLIAHSVAVTLDAVNNFSDAFSSIVTILGIKLAKKKPNNKHPFGYGRVEYFSSVVIAAIILTTGATSMIESVKKIITPEQTSANWVTVTIICAAIVVKILLGLFTRKQGTKYNSDALKASGTDALFDSIISVFTLVGIGVTLLFDINIDGYIGCVIAAFIIKAGFEIFLEALSHIMGKRPDSEISAGIKKSICEIDGVFGAYDLALHYYGPEAAFGSVHVAVNSDLDATEVYKLSAKINKTIAEKYQVFLTVGIYPVDESKQPEVKKIMDTVAKSSGTLGSHGFFIDGEEKQMTFDVVIDFSVNDRAKLAEEIKANLAEIFPGYGVNINFDTNFSD